MCKTSIVCGVYSVEFCSVLTCFNSQADIEKALAIQVDDPIPFMQLLAKSDSGITEVTILRLICEFYQVDYQHLYEDSFPARGFFWFVSLSIVTSCYEQLCSGLNCVALFIFRISLH